MENVRNILIILFKCPNNDGIRTQCEHKGTLFHTIGWLEWINVLYSFLNLNNRG